MNDMELNRNAEFPTNCDLNEYRVIDAIIDDAELPDMKVPYCGGTLIGRVDSGTVTLLDFIGNTRILVIPASITLNGTKYKVNREIPDLSFASCSNIEYIVVDYNLPVHFGACVFGNCPHLAGILSLSFNRGYTWYYSPSDPEIVMDDYSFCAIDEPERLVLRTGYADNDI